MLALLLIILPLGLAIAPVALDAAEEVPSGHTACIQVYPYSEVCKDPAGFVEKVASDPLCNPLWCP